MAFLNDNFQTGTEIKSRELFAECIQISLARLHS